MRIHLESRLRLASRRLLTSALRATSQALNWTKMTVMAKPDGSQRTYTMRSLWSKGMFSTIRVITIICWCGGIFCTIVGISLILTSFNSKIKQPPSLIESALLLIAGVATLWLNWSTNGKVIVTRNGIKTRNYWSRSAQKDQVKQIDIVRSDFRRQLRTLPIVVLKDGRSFPLKPLAWSPPMAMTSTAEITLEGQQRMVDDIRGLLEVSGQNYHPDP